MSKVLVTSYDTLVGAAVSCAREERRISQNAFAKKVGFAQSHLSRIEAGALSITVVHLARIAECLDWQESALLEMVEQTQRYLKTLGVNVFRQKRDASMLTARQVNAMLASGQRREGVK